MRQLPLILLLLLTALPLTAQTVLSDSVDVDLIIQDIYNVMLENRDQLEEDIDYELVYEDLIYIHEHPFNINTATRAQLNQLHFLSAQQIDNILYYIWRFHALDDVKQLVLIPGLADYEVRDLLPFVVALPADSIPPIIKRGKHELKMQMKWNNNELHNYKGDRFAERIAYRYSSNQLLIGLKIDKDQGEPYYYPKRIYGADFYGGYAQWTPGTIIQRICIGDFTANYGQGLTIRQNSSFYTSGSPYDNTADGLKAATGADEYNFLRGAGIMMHKNAWDWAAFYSAKKVDGMAEDGVFSTFSKTGYHRSETELNRKRQVWEQIAGVHASYHKQGLEIGLTVAGDFLSDTLQLKKYYYNENYFQGTNCITAGLDYRYQGAYYTLFGETSITSKGGISTINGARVQFSKKLAFESALRYYSKRFDNPLANSSSVFSHPCGEHGLFLQLTWQPKYTTKWTNNIEFFDYSLPKYGYKNPGWGWKVNSEFNCSLNKGFKLSGKLRWVNKAQNELNGTGLARFQMRWQNEKWQLMSQLSAAIGTNSNFNYGLSLGQQAKYRFQKIPLTIDGELAYFYAPDYETRLYIYEAGGSPFGGAALLYGHGLRTYLALTYKIKKWCKLYARTSYTHTAQKNTSTLPNKFSVEAQAVFTWK